VATVEDFLDDKNADGVRLFRRFQNLAERCGPSTIDVKRTIVWWKRKRIFAGANVNGRRLDVVIDLLRSAEHPLLLVAFPTTKKVVSHRLRFTDAKQLDDSILALLREAYADVGPGTRRVAAAAPDAVPPPQP
jgi:hypothetical protein